MPSGPPYPHQNPAPGSNAIGSFVIGVSPIGTIPFYDFWQTLLMQYANSPILTSILDSVNSALDQTENLDNFYDDIFNVATARGWGLDVWGRIVGVSRAIPVQGSEQYFGFEESTDGFGFEQQAFFTGIQLTNNVLLTDSAFRTLIYAKAMANISDGSITAVNQILMTLFPGRGRAYVVDNADMTIDYVFEFALTPVEEAIVQLSGVLPTAAGVQYTVVVL